MLLLVKIIKLKIIKNFIFQSNINNHQTWSNKSLLFLILLNRQQNLTKMSHKFSDLLSWQVSNPSNIQDILPQPYRLIDQVLQQTIIYQLELAMHHIQQKKKNQNYEGKVPQYIAQSLIQIDNQICCLSSTPKYQNYLLAGDKKGNIIMIDIAKKTIYGKKQLTPNKRIIHISQTTIFDGQTYITIVAAISNNSNVIKVLRMKHNDSKIYNIVDIAISQTQQDINKLPYQAKIQDDGRFLIVKTYQGNIIGYVLPEIRLDENKIKNQQNLNNQALSNVSNTVKKPTIYSFQNCILDKNHAKIVEKKFQIKFAGFQKSLKYKDLLSKLKNKSNKVNQTENAEQTNKKDAKKDTKKVEVPPVQVPKAAQKQIIFNQKLSKKQGQLQNNNDITDPYSKPFYEPFLYIIYSQVQWPRKKSFQKSKNLKMASKIIYGWYNTKQVYSCNLIAGAPKFQNLPYYQQFLLTQTLLTQQQVQLLQASYHKSFNSEISNKNSHTAHKTIYPITSSAISLQQMTHLALGLQDGTVSIYDSASLTLQYNTQKHTSKVTQIQFFQQGWKTISGSDNGQVHINNIFQQKSQIKRTNIFQSKQNCPITDISLNNDIGIAFVIDIKGNIRIYDLWRNEKISRFNTCNSFMWAQNKGKRWVPIKHFTSTQTMYTNKDYSVFLSIEWPTISNSKAIQLPQQLVNKVQELTQNPWKSKQTNIHVIRNFQFLLDNFDGLQNVYKKGYQKAKVLNLFTNLEFTQLYDRNFDIPDFGRTVNIAGNGSTIKSNLSSTSKFNNSNGPNLTKKSSSKQKNLLSNISSGKQMLGGTKNVKLTTEILHPQKFLFQRRKILNPFKELVATNQKMIQTLRQQHKKKQRRANILQDQLNRSSMNGI